MRDTTDIQRLISKYHTSEGIKPRPDRIAWAVRLALQNRFPSILLVARQGKAVVGVALATYSPSAELGRVLMVNDFYVEPATRRKGIGRRLALKLIEEAKRKRIDQVDLEVLPTNAVAAHFWQALSFQTEGRSIYSLKIERGES